MSQKTVFVGMSGGVDSSLTAALMQEAGHKVVGVYMKNWTQDLPGFACPWKEDFQDAKRVAVGLGIELLTFDFENEYREKVVQYMIDEYTAGRTPNPDIMCNQEVKFKLFLEASLDQGADMIATGHYARVDHTAESQLRVAANAEKDQTYFLYRVTEVALARTYFPIGEFASKADVREAARIRGIDTADKKDSQGICFVGKVGIKDFLKQYVTTSPGAIIDQHGRTIGEHDGAIFYTIGQRHGLNVGGGLPYYVTGKDMLANTVHVTSNLDDPQLWSRRLIARAPHWINDQPDPAVTYGVQLRYRGPLVPCSITVEGDEVIIELTEEQRALAAGQSAVVYEGDRVVGGAIIAELQR